MTRLFLGLQALLFLSFGLFSLMQPDSLSQILGLSGVGTDGLFELRSNYGGVSLGAGGMCLAGALRPSLVRPALFFLLAYTGGYALGRIIGLALGDALPATSLLGYGIIEGVTVVLSLFLLRRTQA